MNSSATSTTGRPVSDDVWTVRRILTWTTEHLKQHGSDSPRVEAEILLAHARHCPRIQLYTAFDEPLSDEERAQMRDLVKRRAKAEPVAYLVGYREFFSLQFEVTSDVLIPRPETETLVMEALDVTKEIKEPELLDMCTGSGCVAIAAVKNHPSMSATATDISSSALEIAKRNAEKHQVAERITFVESNLFEAVSDGSQFDVITANPPYVTNSEWEELEDHVRLHEPQTALIAGVDGLDVVRPLIAEVPRYLKPGGTIFIEIDPAQESPVRELFESWATEVTSIRDWNKDVRVMKAVKGEN
ncbi:peptide chain release factor N(5)-glutamine methyltransferase [Calycomorphotria hydatis]|uniref:Release factor glutamine methyltransferase n=1 Tax=Calycomorphotria hydatis TaxID=2528027 RepID=A0A517T807_9PLAN|nr:peptide chain release factor N(5)-glutamine methyltransferase [Calycomorphotria hydatis]QDT64509.1 Release factor glutamine methyltransferase [Calycomorphotria hydatis]